MDDPWEISRQLAARRRELGLSLSQLARRANTSAATLSRYERGWARFELYTLRKLATALGCRLAVTLEPRGRTRASVEGSEVVRVLGRLFWDQKLSARHLKEHPAWVAKRVLEYGSLDDVELLVSLMGRERFLRTVGEVRFETEKTRIFWQRMLDREGISCTNASFPREAGSFWRSSRT